MPDLLDGAIQSRLQLILLAKPTLAYQEVGIVRDFSEYAGVPPMLRLSRMNRDKLVRIHSPNKPIAITEDYSYSEDRRDVLFVPRKA